MLSGRRPLPMIIESANIRYNQTTDYIEVLNPNTGEWEEWEKSGVVFQGTNIIVTTKNLNGKTVTCTVGGETYTSVFVGGSATFTVYFGGTATITCEGITQTVTVVEGQTQTLSISRPPATLTLTTENLNGKTVTVLVGGVTYTGIFQNNTVAFTVYETGTATITCDTVTKTQQIASGGNYSVAVTKPYAVIDINTTDLNGYAVSLVVDGVTYNGTFSGNTVRFTVYHFGSAKITAGYAEVTQTVTAGQSYTLTMNKPFATINLTTSNLNGHTVTIAVNGASYTVTFSGGSATVKVYEFGNATVTSTNASLSFTVTKGETYNKTLNRPQAVLNFTTSDLNGQSITVTINNNTYNVTFSNKSASLTLYEFGTATITCGYATASQAVASGGTYTVTLNRPYCMINLTSSTLHNQPVSVSVGGNTYSGTFNSSGTVSIKVYDVFGTATITSTNASTTVSTAKGGSYNVTLNRPKAVINLTTDNLQGQTITFNVDGGSNTQVAFGSDGTLSLTVYVFGTYTFTCSETTVTQAVASGGTYTVDITEITRVDLMLGNTLYNGCEFVADSYYHSSPNGMTCNEEYSHEDHEDMYKFPKNNDFNGKTLYIKYKCHGYLSARLRYGVTSSGFYKDFTLTAYTYGSVATLAIPLLDGYFSKGYTESFYLAMQGQRVEPEGSDYSIDVSELYIE